MRKRNTFRHHFFFRSQYGNVIFPKLFGRLVISMALATLCIQWVWAQVLYNPPKDTTTDVYYAVYYFLVIVCCEVMLRMHLLRQRTRHTPINIFLKDLVMFGTIPLVAYVLVVKGAQLIGWLPVTDMPSSLWLLGFIASLLLYSLVLLAARFITYRYFPKIHEDLQPLDPIANPNAIARNRLKKITMMYEGDDFDEAEFDAKHAADFSEEGYHRYRMNIARTYLDTPPFELHNFDEVMLEDVVVFFDDERYAFDVVEEVALTIHDGKFSASLVSIDEDDYWIKLQYGQKEASVGSGTRLRDYNRMLCTLAQLLAPHYEIRECISVLRHEAQFFMTLPRAEWEQLTAEYGKKKMKRYFKPVDSSYRGLSRRASPAFQIYRFMLLPATQRW